MTNLPRLLIILLCSIPNLALPAAAQTEVPPPVFPKPQPLPETEPLPPLENILPQPTTPPEQPEPSTDIPATVTVTQFNVEGSTVFSPEELATVLEPFTNRPLSFAQLLEAQQAITQLYFDKGYITSGAFIPPQEIADGVVTIQVIEGEVEEIKIEGLGHLKPGYVRSRVALGAKKPFNRNKLLNALQLLQLDPLIDKLDAELASGSRPGKSILTVKAIDADAFSLQIGMDNQRSPSVGSTRRTLDIEHGNVLGIGDRFHVGYINTNGSNSLNDLSYTIPINPQNGTIGFSYSLSNSHIIEEPFDQLDIESNTVDYELTYRQPILQTPNQELALGLTASRQESKTELLNEPFPLSAGADENGETKVSALRFFQDYTARDNRQVFALRSQFSFGIDAFDATTNEDTLQENGIYFQLEYRPF
jgi:hemolysin activation/secretion protein